MRRMRVGTGNLLSAAMLPIGIIAAVSLVVMAQLGGVDTAVFVVVGAIATVAAFVSLEFGVLALILVASIDGFLKGLSPGWHTQLIKDYVLAICLLRWAWLSVLGHRRRSMRHPISAPIILFVAWCTVQLVNARNPGFLLVITNYRAWVIWIPTFFLAFDYITTRKHIDRFIVFTLALLTPIAFYALIQYEIGLDHLFRLSPGFSVYSQSAYVTPEYETQLRPPGTMVSEHALAGSCVMGLMLAAGAIGYFRRERRLQVLSAVSLPILAMAVIVTAVRNAFASAVLAMLALLLLIRRPDLAIVALVVGGLGGIAADQLTGGRALSRMQTIIDDPQRTSARVLTPWRTSVNHVARYPLGGGLSSGMGRGRLMYGTVGTGGVSPESRVPWIENEYGRTLVELGLPGFLLFVWMLFAITRGVYRAYSSAERARDRWLLAGIFGAVISMLARLLVGSALYGWPEGILFWCYVAMALRLTEIEDYERQRERVPRSEAPDVIRAPQSLPWARGR